ncbi:MAG: Flp pilus assembly protein CpaB, partial [Pirellulaceae bacterium]
MRAKSLVLFVIAVGCGLAASIGVSQYMESANGGSTQTETAKILVAMTDINIGEKLDAQTVKLEGWPKDRVPEGAVYELSGIEGKYPRTRMYAGEPILLAKLMDSNKDSPAVTIPKGFRVVSVKVSVETAGGGLIQPGDRVDVLVLLRKSSEIPETGTRTILRDVNVFSVDGATERAVDEEGRTRTLSTVSLLLKPRQAESVMLASDLGRLFLTLRRPDDDTEEVGHEGETVRSLLGNDGESANEKAVGQNDDLPTWLTGAQNGQPQTIEPTDEVATPVETPPKWKMVILGSTGTREFLWSDIGELPTEAGNNSSGNEYGVASPRAAASRSQPPARR